MASLSFSLSRGLITRNNWQHLRLVCRDLNSFHMITASAAVDNKVLLSAVNSAAICFLGFFFAYKDGWPQD